MPQTEPHPAFDQRLLPGERIVSAVENVSFRFLYVPHLLPGQDFDVGYAGALALTNRRLLVVFGQDETWRWLHIPALVGLWERQFLPAKVTWRYKGAISYQAVLLVPGGLGVVVQPWQTGAAESAELSALLNQALLQLGASRDDAGATAAIIAHEEEEERRRRLMD